MYYESLNWDAQVIQIGTFLLFYRIEMTNNYSDQSGHTRSFSTGLALSQLGQLMGTDSGVWLWLCCIISWYCFNVLLREEQYSLQKTCFFDTDDWHMCLCYFMMDATSTRLREKGLVLHLIWFIRTQYMHGEFFKGLVIDLRGHVQTT